LKPPHAGIGQVHFSSPSRYAMVGENFWLRVELVCGHRRQRSPLEEFQLDIARKHERRVPGFVKIQECLRYLAAQ